MGGSEDMTRTYPELPEISEPGLAKRWMTLQLLKFKRNAFGKRYDPALFSDAWIISLARDITRESDLDPEVAEHDVRAIKRVLADYFYRQGFQLKSLTMLSVGVRTGSSDARQVWQVRVEVS